jgi:integrating conjugative element membrane protein (TIGR03747 family)
MEHNKQQHPKIKKPPTLIGLVLHNIFMFFCLGIIAWIFLLVWFGVDLYMNHFMSRSDYIGEIIQHDLHFIMEHHLPYFNAIIEWVANSIKGTKALVQQCITWINVILAKFHRQVVSDNLNLDYQIVHVLLDTLAIVSFRLLICLMAIPFIVAFIILSCVDGLVQRDIRKHQGARESTFFFHKVKELLSKSVFIILLIYLAFPYMIPPIVMLIPLSIVISLILSLSLKNYKKYV